MAIDLEPDVGAVEAADDHSGSRMRRRSTISSRTGGRGGGRQRQHRGRPRRSTSGADAHVVGAEVVAPLGDAVRLVHHEQRHVRAGKPLHGLLAERAARAPGTGTRAPRPPAPRAAPRASSPRPRRRWRPPRPAAPPRCSRSDRAGARSAGRSRASRRRSASRRAGRSRTCPPRWPSPRACRGRRGPRAPPQPGPASAPRIRGAPEPLVRFRPFHPSVDPACGTGYSPRPMAYLNCPSCRLTVYSPTPGLSSEECPRCRAKLGKVSRLFRSALPARLAEARKDLPESRPDGARSLS